MKRDSIQVGMTLKQGKETSPLLVDLKGKGFQGGWSVLVEKLRFLGVAPLSKGRRVCLMQHQK